MVAGVQTVNIFIEIICGCSVNCIDCSAVLAYTLGPMISGVVSVYTRSTTVEISDLCTINISSVGKPYTAVLAVSPLLVYSGTR